MFGTTGGQGPLLGPRKVRRPCEKDLAKDLNFANYLHVQESHKEFRFKAFRDVSGVQGERLGFWFGVRVHCLGVVSGVWGLRFRI